MTWEEYERNYFELAKMKGKTDSYCIEQLKYAKPLFDKGLPVIYSQEHLSKLLGYSLEYLYAASNSINNFYRTFYITKKNGGTRRIDEPLPSLKEIQKWILEEVLEPIPESPYSKAYKKGKSVKDNARIHRNQEKVLLMDMKDFFGSIHYGRVYSLFLNLGYKDSVAVMLANLCCYDNYLPQGASTSPKLANLIAANMDYRIWNCVKKNGIRYTRYADDMTLSGTFDEKKLIKKIERIVSESGFMINDNKTRVRRKHQRQEVTGIVVNEKLQLNKHVRRYLRKNAYYIKKYGLEDHLQHINETKSNYLYHMIGLTSYALFINPNDEHLKEYLSVFKSQLKKDR